MARRPSRRAQRRPGREPRRHSTRCAAVRRASGSLNEGRGVSPGDTRFSTRGASGPAAIPLNEGRGVSPGDTCPRLSPSPSHPRPLNEGRGVSPGDTLATPTALGAWRARAQRRPGREPRRHVGLTRAIGYDLNAQRRPGREPRRHRGINPLVLMAQGAQRRPGREPRRHRPCRLAASATRTPLNEGRGVSPGDTRNDGGGRAHRRRRSTKAGA